MKLFAGIIYAVAIAIVIGFLVGVFTLGVNGTYELVASWFTPIVNTWNAVKNFFTGIGNFFSAFGG